MLVHWQNGVRIPAQILLIHLLRRESLLQTVLWVPACERPIGREPLKESALNAVPGLQDITGVANPSRTRHLGVTHHVRG